MTGKCAATGGTFLISTHYFLIYHHKRSFEQKPIFSSKGNFFRRAAAKRHMLYAPQA